jgi:hypothetical protein
MKEIVRNDADLKTFVERIETAEDWLAILGAGKAASAAAM